jgi:hypothetical protein
MARTKNPEKPLNKLELSFISAYDGTRTQAECYNIASGKVLKNAARMASRMMKDPRILNAIHSKQNVMVTSVAIEQGEDLRAVAHKYNINLDRIFKEYDTLLTSGESTGMVKARCLEALSKIFGLMSNDRDDRDPLDPMRWPAAKLQAFMERGAWVPDIVKEAIVAERLGRPLPRLIDSGTLGPKDTTATPRA